MAKRLHHKGVSPLVKILNNHILPIKSKHQGTGNIGLENFKSITIVDTSKMSTEEKANYINQFNKGK